MVQVLRFKEKGSQIARLMARCEIYWIFLIATEFLFIHSTKCTEMDTKSSKYIGNYIISEQT